MGFYSMARDKQKGNKEVKRKIKKQVAAHVKNAFPGCIAEFCGQQSGAALVSRTFGFRVREQGGKYRSNIIWVDPDYSGEINEAWVRGAVARSHG
jgi:hypothetical protein